MHLLRPRHDEPAHSPAGSVSHLATGAVGAVLDGRPGSDFLVRRLTGETRTLPEGRERSALSHLSCVLEDGVNDVDVLSDALVLYAAVLEREGALDPAAETLDAVARRVPHRSDVTLHAARIARKRGDREGALARYRAVRRNGRRDAGLARMAAVGEAMLAADPARALGEVLRDAIRCGDREAAAVAQEERARARRAAGDRSGALRDYLVAAARFPSDVDAGRVLHEASDLMAADGDLLAVRELLLAASTTGRPEQRDHARTRLHAVSRTLGDELGRRRWSGSRPAALVSLTPARAGDSADSRAPRLHRRLRRLGLVARTDA